MIKTTFQVSVGRSIIIMNDVGLVGGIKVRPLLHTIDLNFRWNYTRMKNETI